MPKLTRTLRASDGFTMVAVLGVMLFIVGISVAAFATVNGDLALARNNQDQKAAYGAAEAGLNEYAFHLAQNPDYWTNCTNVPAGDVTQPGGTPRWRTVSAGSAGSYTIEMLPANGASTCNAASSSTAFASMIDAATGTFRIRVTGRSRSVTRSIVATFRRRGFLDYLYFTDLEDLDPALFGGGQSCYSYYRQGRSGCQEIQFASGDVVAGPMHTNDQMLVCGGATFGRTAQDAEEASDIGPALSPPGTLPPGYRSVSGCSGAPNFLGTFTPGAPALTLPQTNGTLSNAVAANYKFTGKTTIVLSGSTMTVTNATRGLNNASMALPSNGVVYVANGTCGQTYALNTPYPTSQPDGCADVYLKGSLTVPLTIASEKDIIVNGNVTTSSALLGLIANSYVRVWHPVYDASGNGGGRTGSACPNAYPSGTSAVTEIDAAILALQHSFIVDNFSCGAPVGSLTIKGAIAQKFRGAVGTGGAGSVSTGYAKAYSYDDRLRYQTPPSFLDPVQTSWRIQRFTEQAPSAY